MLGFPFDSIITGKDPETGLPKFDRGQYSYQFQSYLGRMFTDGILPNIKNCLKVVPGSGMQVLVNPGICIAGGAIGVEESKRSLSIQASDQSLDRIDAVVVRKDNTKPVRSIDLYVKKGVPSNSPVAPLPQRDSLTNPNGIYEIIIAYVFVSRSTNAVSPERITDKRFDGKVCGVSSTYNTVDTTDLFTQFTAEFNKIFEQMENLLDGNAAGKLQVQINDLDKTMASLTEQLKYVAKYTPEIIKKPNFIAYKYPDGTMKVEKNVSGKVNFNEKWFGLYTAFLDAGNWDIPFLEKPKITGVVNNTPYGAWLNSVYDTSETVAGRYNFTRPDAQTIPLEITITATGRWK